MKVKLIFSVLIVTLLAAPAAAQNPGRLVFYADQAGTSCEIDNTVAETVTIHMYLKDGVNQNTVFFYAPTPACWTGAVWLSDDINPGFLHLGSTHDTVYQLSITFVGCKDSPLYLGSMTFWASGSEPCCEYEVLPQEMEGMIGIVDCSLNLHEIPYETVVINPDESCRCNLVLETEESTWGYLKALYR